MGTRLFKMTTIDFELLIELEKRRPTREIYVRHSSVELWRFWGILISFLLLTDNLLPF